MNSLTRIATIAIAASIFQVPAMAQRMPRNSFLRKPVYSVTQLIEHVRTDPVVLKHYLAHYSGSDVQVSTKEELIGYFRTLKTGKIMAGGKMKIYRVNKHGVIDYTMQNIKSGTLAFFDPDGRPMLIRSCGNPTKYPFTEIVPQPPQLILMENPVPTEVVPGPTPIIPPPPGPMSDVDLLPPIAPGVPDVPVVERRRSFIPIPIPIPFTRTRTKECPPIPGPAAAITFLGIAAANRLRRKRNA